jgi:hypothetical protein
MGPTHDYGTFRHKQLSWTFLNRGGGSVPFTIAACEQPPSSLASASATQKPKVRMLDLRGQGFR